MWAATALAAPTLLWRIWAGIILAQILAAGIIGTAPTASALSVAAMIPAALVDVRSRRLPNRIVGAAAVVLAAALAAGAARGLAVDFAHVAVGAAAMAGPLLAIHLLSPGSMGFGDVKAATVLGAAAGVVHWQLALSALALAAGFSATAAILANARTIPFGPGLVSGAAIALTLSPVFAPTVDDAPGHATATGTGTGTGSTAVALTATPGIGAHR